MPYEHLTSANDERLAPYARVRDADLAAWPDASAGLFMAESRAVIAAAIEAGARPRSFLVSESWAGDAALLAGIAVFSAAVVFAGNFAANVLYGVVDPRIRKGGTRA